MSVEKECKKTMLTNTLISRGENNFKNFVFSSREWSAPTMVSPEEIRELIRQSHLVGRRVKRIKMIGLSYFLTRDCIEDSAYEQLAQYEEEERQKCSNYKNIDPSIELMRTSLIDEPLLIEFEDGDVFEIDTPQQPEFRISMNCIPWSIKAGTNQPNVDANILFSPCHRQSITSVELKTYFTDKDPMFNIQFNDGLGKRELVSYIILRFENGVGLSIGGWIDYCAVDCIDEDNNLMKIPFGKLKSALFNWEDLHTDETVGYESETSTFFFGREAAEHTNTPYMTLVPGDKNTSLNIYIDDFILFNWSITHIEHEFFDIYGAYNYNCAQWEKILNEAEKLLNFESFDDLFDYVVNPGIKNRSGENYPLIQINNNGVSFWKDKEKLRTQLKDMRGWTKLALSETETMHIYGF